jgi:ATP-dependent DNA ligase
MQPMLAETIDERRVVELCHDPNVWMQLKVDGHRRLIRIADGQVTPHNREGGTTSLPSRVAAALQALPASPHVVWIDGELVGKELWLFDIAHLDGKVDKATPFEKRLAWLEALAGVGGWNTPGSPVRLLATARTADTKLGLVRAVLAERGEGVIVRRVDAGYREGPKRSKGVLKVKFRHTVDCIVAGFGRHGHDNIILELVGEPPVINAAAEVVGISGERPRYDVGEVTALAGDGPKIKVAAALAGLAYVWGTPVRQLVVEVTCLYASNDDRLYQPTLPRLRWDKAPDECGVDQLEPIRVNKEIITW